MRRDVSLCLCAFALVAAGCAGSALDASDAGKSASYQPGTASFDIEIAPLHSDADTGIDLYVGVPPPSLVYSRTPQGFRGLYDVTARLLDRATSAFAGEFMWKETTDVAVYDDTQRFDPLVISHRILLPPGSYVAEVTLEDLASTRTAMRRQGFIVVDPTVGQPTMGRLILQSRTPEGKFLPRVSFHVPALAESLRCAVEVYNAERDVPVPVAIQILRFPADTTFALPPFTYSVMARPMGYGLMHLDRADTVLRVQRETRITRRKQRIAFYLPVLAEGLYRFDIQVTLPPNAEMPAETTLSTGRFSSLKGTGFPRPSTLGELIAATGYIATSKEYAELTSALPAAQRTTFEAFWLNLGGTKAGAASLIKKYYTRVEEANRLFTTVREGWKTDRGMIYIILGPPEEIASRLDKQDWVYSLPGGGTSSNLYSFKRVIYQGEGLSVEEFVLHRRSDYETFWDRMVDKWRGPGGP